MDWSEHEETLLASYLADRVIDFGAGRAEHECLANYPHDTYFIGNLRPVGDSQEEESVRPQFAEELRTKLSPMAIGADLLALPLNGVAEVVVDLQWSVYYRIFPTLAQQRRHQQLLRAASDDVERAPEPSSTDQSKATKDEDTTVATLPDDGAQDMSEEPPEDEGLADIEDEESKQAEDDSPEVVVSASDRRQARGRGAADSLFIRFRKVECRASGRVIFRSQASGEFRAEPTELQASLERETTRAQRVASQDPERIRTGGAPNEFVRVPDAALTSEAAYRSFIGSLGTDVVPEWHWRCLAKSRGVSEKSSSEVVLSLEFVNVSPQQRGPLQARDNPNIEPFLFDAQGTLKFTLGEPRPFVLELAPRGFRLDRNLWGWGLNCAVEKDASSPDTLRIVHTPVHHQPRYSTRTEPQAPFDTLARNPIPVLVAILDSMEQYRDVWVKARSDYLSADANWDQNFGGTFAGERQQFDDEITLYRRGYEMIRDNPDIRQAFMLTNEAFRRMGDHPTPEKRRTAWRLFQIVFLVSQVPGMAALQYPVAADVEERRKVDVIYFPTGGGKTEAYLGEVVFHCFFDRLRGKTAGVTAWTRFPLRLLTAQQMQRMADAIGMAELVRREQTDARLVGSSVAEFAVGYFVGEGGTPNEIVDPKQYTWLRGDGLVTWATANDDDARQKWRVLLTCPACRTNSVRVTFDSQRATLQHRCSRPECAFLDGALPVYVVDNDIYRNLPCVIVGTIDKLAGLGNQRKVAQLFGDVDGICPSHGYYKLVCCQKGCPNRRLPRGVPSGLSGPSLFIQDELHLLKEGLGTFDGHYETFAQELRTACGATQPLKVVASSATIEAFGRQIEHLYGRSASQARVFPGPGPRLGQSFYAETLESPQRLYVGLLPHNKTIFNSILELIERYHREIQILQQMALGGGNPYGGALTPGTAQWRNLLDFYATSVTYFLAGRELDSIRTDIEGDVSPHLRQSGLAALEMTELTGNTPTPDVTGALERLERHAPNQPSTDAVLATSMLSHGVDIDRLNAMIFYGMPRQNAEYIQASSRIGRTHVGITFVCMHPMRERDRSHYSYFAKFHEFLGQLVEPVAINRWAKFSIHRTLPGLFMGVLLQLVSNRSSSGSPGRYYLLDHVRQQITAGQLAANDFIPILEAAYGVASPSTIGEHDFQTQIRKTIPMFLYDQIVAAGPQHRFVSEVLIPRPMRSLRDVDDPVMIELDSDGTQWSARAPKA